MNIDIVCSKCKYSLDGSFNTARDEAEIEICPNCLVEEKKLSYDEGYEQGYDEAGEG